MRFALLILVVLTVFAPRAVAAEPVWEFRVRPTQVQLDGPDARRGLLVDGRRGGGPWIDFTRQARFETATADAPCRVSHKGVIEPLRDGQGQIRVRLNHGGRSISLPVAVQIQATGRPRDYHFENDIVPILSKYGCNTSGCHGKAEGQNGFKLSVFGFAPQADYDALTKEARGRRAFPAAAEQSLLLTKASGGVPHGGGIRLDAHSREYRTLRGWIAAGAPYGRPDAPRVVRVEIFPKERILGMQKRQQLRVIAHRSDGRQEDVTSIARYQSNNDALGKVDAAGLVATGGAPGQFAVMATYAGAVATFRAIIPRAAAIRDYPPQVEHNYIDRLVHRQLRQLNILPSGGASDADFLRRAYLDIIGTLPTAAEARRFLEDSRDDKRARLVDALLERPEYADYWALKWADLLRVDRRALGHKAAYAYYGWIRRSFENSKPFDRFARDLVTAAGRTRQQPQSHFYRVVGGAGNQASTFAQVFLGVRIACAQCHHHPFDRWSQTDYYGMAAFFQQVQRKGTPRGEVLFAQGDPATRHPRTAARIYAYALGESMPAQSPAGDRRRTLAAWMTAKDNRWFARATVNRLWAHFLGRGLVEPVDDFRDTNPPSNPDLLQALAEDFVKHDFDLKHLIRRITASRTYQRSTRPNATNARDEQNYSRALFKRLDAEVLLDAVNQVTGSSEKFTGVPYGARAIQLWDSETPHYFLKLFGRPTRKTACECERAGEPNISQVLHVLNSPEIQAKLSHVGGRVVRLAEQHADDGRLVDELFLTFFARFPSSSEKSAAERHLRSKTGRRTAAEDLAWSLLNTIEFSFNH